MKETGVQTEKIFEQKSSIAHYYRDLKRAMQGGDCRVIMTGAEQFIRSEIDEYKLFPTDKLAELGIVPGLDYEPGPVVPVHTAIGMMYESNRLPSGQRLMKEPTKAYEQLALLPISVVGPIHEFSSCPTNQLAWWYASAVQELVSSTYSPDNHTCIVDGGDDGCIVASPCTRGTAALLLVTGIAYPDFESVEPDQLSRHVAIQLAKLEAAKQGKLVCPDTSDKLEASYKQRYQDYFGRVELINTLRQQ